MDNHLHSPIVIVLVWSGIIFLTGAAAGCAIAWLARSIWR
jgi:hypothetical protein